MADRGWSSVLGYLRRTTGPPAEGAGDGRPLERFVAARDEPAFAALLERHGPMVWGVCRGTLPNAADAEDAFQATFLVLIRKAASIVRPERLGPWLYGVALRTARKARAAAARRRRHQAGRPPPAPSGPPRDDDLGPVLDEEVRRLPERLRAPFVLCALEGQTNEEAARQLGCPVGTVQSRLSRARGRLRARLTRRGWAPSVTVVAGSLAGAADAAVPPALVQSTLPNAVWAVAHPLAAGPISASVAVLTEGVIRAMFWEKAKMVGLVILALAVVGTGGGVASYRTAAPAPVAAVNLATAARPAPPPDRSHMKRLLREELEAARVVNRTRDREYLAGRVWSDSVYEWSRRVLEIELKLSETKGDRIIAYERHLKSMQDLEKINKDRFGAGRISQPEMAATKVYRLEAEIWLEEARAR